MKKIILILISILVLFVNEALADGEDMSLWAKPEIEEAISLGFVPADLQNNYKTPMTRAEFAKLSVSFVAYHFDMQVDEMVNWYLSSHVDGSGNALVFKEDSFTDIERNEHAYFIKCANSMNIVNGKGDNLFDPDAFITREEAATMLIRVYFCYGSGVKLGPKSAGVDCFSDVQDISPWADSAVRYMYQWDVMKGISDTSYAPKDYYTKEQSIATFLRLDGVYSIR